MDCIVHGITKSQTQLSDFHFQTTRELPCFTFLIRELNHAVKTRLGGFPGSPVVKNPPANAGDIGLIPHGPRQLSPYVKT